MFIFYVNIIVTKKVAGLPRREALSRACLTPRTVGDRKRLAALATPRLVPKKVVNILFHSSALTNLNVSF